MAATADPPMNSRFLVEIDGISGPNVVHVSGLESRIEAVELRSGGDPPNVVRKLPGRVHYPNVVLRYTIDQDDELFAWHLQWAQEGQQAARRDLAITLLDAAGTPLRRWAIFRAWPAKWQGPVLDAHGSEVALQTIELAHEGIEIR